MRILPACYGRMNFFLSYGPLFNQDMGYVQQYILYKHPIKYSIEAHMGLLATKPVFGVSNKVRFKPVCSATEAS